jgi:hypothetical protein
VRDPPCVSAAHGNSVLTARAGWGQVSVGREVASGPTETFDEPSLTMASTVTIAAEPSWFDRDTLPVHGGSGHWSQSGLRTGTTTSPQQTWGLTRWTMPISMCTLKPSVGWGLLPA